VLTRGRSLVVVLADGAGGMRGGATAADAFVLAVRQAVDDHGFDIDSAPSWSDLFRATDRDLAAKTTGETTAIVIALGTPPKLSRTDRHCAK
jgi:serine/threonine protein phosphatase PrpC